MRDEDAGVDQQEEERDVGFHSAGTSSNVIRKTQDEPSQHEAA
jgi:hypothetical protein